MYEDVLSEIGLTKSEIAVYFALLEIGSSTTGPIIKKAKIASGKAYLILDKLIEKGLVTYAIKSGVKYYQAKDPERLLDYLKEKEIQLKKKEKQLETVIPKLKSQYKEIAYKPVAEVFEGVKGFKTLLEEELKQLKRGDTINLTGVPKTALEKFQGYLLYWNKKRIKAGIKMKIIYNHDCKRLARKRDKMPLTEVKYMKESLETPAWTAVFKDYVTIKNVQATPVCFLIKNKETADSYKKYFNMLWKIATK
ncbi:hypothetical protein GF361_03150 [Candidatus Woesearchaeota archaeon]|nr:hypothetical protein [Candidatus Woesearchaeota archaeon]